MVSDLRCDTLYSDAAGLVRARRGAGEIGITDILLSADRGYARSAPHLTSRMTVLNDNLYGNFCSAYAADGKGIKSVLAGCFILVIIAASAVL